LAGVNKMMTSLVKGSLVDFPVALTEGLKNVPLMYGETVRKRKPIIDWKSGSKEAGKNFVNGFADPIWCLFKQPAVGLSKHGGLGLFTGLGKAGMGLVVKPGSGKQSKPFLLITLNIHAKWRDHISHLLAIVG
jgi:sterol 3beta-glucosyltransferase